MIATTRYAHEFAWFFKKYYGIQELCAHAGCKEDGEVIAERLGAVDILAAGSAGNRDAAVGAVWRRGSGEPAVEAAVVEVMAATSVHPALTVLSFFVAA